MHPFDIPALPFTETDVEAACCKLRPYAQRLVERFGEAQAFEIMLKVADTVCPYGQTEAPAIHILQGSLKAERLDASRG